MGYKTLTVEKSDHVATITLNRPDKGNALNGEMHRELWEVWNDFRFDADTWTAILTGAGDSFCAGEDLDEIRSALRKDTVPDRYQEPRDGRNWGFRYEHYRRRKLNVWKPTIIAVNGACAGTGLVLVGQGDLVLASDKASFSCPATSLGMVPVEETLYLADRIPLGEVLRLAVMGDAFSMPAERAVQVSLASELIPTDKLLDRATEIALMINDQAGDAVRAMANTMHMRRDLGYDDSLNIGYEYHERFQNVENMLEGPRAFTEKRKPNWVVKPPQMG